MDEQTKRMIETIKLQAREAAPWVGRSAIDAQVLAALAKVPRVEFVPADLACAAYDDGPLPIGHGQTISQPYIVALMTDLLRPRPEHVVLEVGTGSGYQAAVLARLVSRVYSVEVVQALAADAAARLRRLGHDNVEVRWSDGYAGWPEHAPYDGIIVTAAVPEIPPPLIEQLRPGGRLVAPVRNYLMGQDLVLVEKDTHGAVQRRSILPVAFVPLVRARAEPAAEHMPG